MYLHFYFYQIDNTPFGLVQVSQSSFFTVYVSKVSDFQANRFSPEIVELVELIAHSIAFSLRNTVKFTRMKTALNELCVSLSMYKSKDQQISLKLPYNMPEREKQGTSCSCGTFYIQVASSETISEFGLAEYTEVIRNAGITASDLMLLPK